MTGAQQPHDGAGAQHFGAGAQHFGAGAQHFGAGVQHFGAGAQQDGAGEQLDALPQPPRLPNRPACTSAAEATTTEQTTRLATKNRLIGTSLGKQFSSTRNAGHSWLVLLSHNTR
jgi:hypothetical protein